MKNRNVKKILAITISSALLVSAATMAFAYENEAKQTSDEISLSIAGDEAGETAEAATEGAEAATEGAEAATEGTEAEAVTESGTEKKVDYAQLETTAGSDGLKALDVTEVVENAMPSVVAIASTSVQKVEDYFGGSQEIEGEGAGSGFIIAKNDDELLIATNNHVVEDAKELSVCFSVDADNEEKLVAPAVVKGTSAAYDLAVVAVKLSDIDEDVYKQLRIATLGHSDNLKVGQAAIVIGNALGSGQTVTTGIISALGREITTDAGTFTEFQTDAAINLGCSGGAILNAKGEVIGITSAKATGDYAEAMGYGIPTDTAIPVLEKLINRQTRDAVEDHGFLGITVVPVSDEAKSMYNMPAGAFVYEVTEGSAADEAGIKKGDIITEFDGIEIDSSDTLVETLGYYAVDETVKVKVQTSNNGTYEEKEVEVKLQKGSAEAKKSQEDAKEKNDQSSDDGASDQDDQSGSNNSQQMPYGGNGGYSDGNGFDDFFRYFGYGNGNGSF